MLFEAIAIHPATKLHLLHHVISLYVIIKMATLRAHAYGLVRDENRCYFVSIVSK